jgi:hypothetical protein
MDVQSLLSYLIAENSRYAGLKFQWLEVYWSKPFWSTRVLEYWGKEKNNGRHRLKMSNVKAQMPNQILMSNDKKERVIELLGLGF